MKQTMLSNEVIAENLLSDIYSYRENIKEIIVGRLMDSTNSRVYWDAWFRGATGKDLENADKGIPYIPTKKVEALTLDSLIKIRYLENNEIYLWALGELLDRVNEDNATDDYNYDLSDWREGFNQTLEGEFYSLLDESGNELNSLLDYQ
jgi:hypothetical protein